MDIRMQKHNQKSSNILQVKGKRKEGAKVLVRFSD